MANPIISQLAKEIVSTAQQGQKHIPKVDKAKTGPSKFDKMMEQTKPKTQEQEAIKKLVDSHRLEDPAKFKTAKAKDIVPEQTKDVTKTKAGDESSADFKSGQEKADRLLELLGDVNDGANQLERLMDVLTSGQKLSPQELIAIQLSVTQFAEELEVAGKLVQETTQGVRQTLNTQIG